VSVPSSPTEEESTVIGSKLHRIINNMINSKPMVLAALTESQESSSAHSHHHDLPGDTFREDNPSSLDSDYRADIFEDKHVKTAVETFSNQEKNKDCALDEPIEGLNQNHIKVTYQSATELQKVEESLHQRISISTFQKRLRIKNLTPTPKQSTQQVFLLQSGDAGSLLLKSALSTSLKLSNSRSDNTTNIKSLTAITNSQVDWTLPKIPMQITTVGYAFPKYNQRTHAMKSLHDLFEKNMAYVKNSNDDISQCVVLGSTEKIAQDTPINDTPNNTNQEDQNNTLLVKDTRESGNQQDNALKELSAAINQSVDKVETKKIEDNLEQVNCTSSLDILVGLLNEIQKITACHISNTGNCNDQESKMLDSKFLSGHDLNVLENYDSNELVSINSLDKLRQLESSASIYSLYISNDESEFVGGHEMPKVVPSALCRKMPSSFDKEVNVDLPERQIMNNVTNVPSKLFPLTITHSTNVSNSLLGIMSKPSSAIPSVVDYETLTDSSLNCKNKIVEISQAMTNTEMTLIATESTNLPLNKKMVVKKQFRKKWSKSTNFMSLREPKLLTTKYNKEFDPLFKMKRDILVTVYSMLVLTVFAALSFPEILYYA
jgi:hypothetical protein